MAHSEGFSIIEKTIIGFLTVGGLFICALQLIFPVNTTSKAPRLIDPTYGLAAEQAQRNATATERTKTTQLTTTGLKKTFQALGYDFADISKPAYKVPRYFLRQLPKDLETIKKLNDRKALFLKALLPLTLKINEDLMAQRAKIWRLRHRLKLNQSIKSEERIWLHAMFSRYRITNQNFDRLLARLDTVPPSLVLTQAAIESGWGTSRFAQLGNALFGQWTFNPKHKGIVPEGRAPGKTHRIRAFDTLGESLHAYMLNLNTHKAYGAFREMRKTMRQNQQPLNGFELATTLDKYSERGYEYVEWLQAIMERNNLQAADKARLSDIYLANSPVS